MSKFVYILHHRLSGDSREVDCAERIEKVRFITEGTWQKYSAFSKQVFIWQQAPNVKVDGNLNVSIGLPKGDNSNSCLLQITDNSDTVEVKGDLLGTRAIWYYSDNRILVVSNSQRAIIAITGDYQPNQEAWTWMLSNGSLGPGLSWDRRIKALDAGATLFFDKKNFSPREKRHSWRFDYSETDPSAMAGRLEQLLQEVSLDFPLGEVPALLTLSGGYDSRAALYLLKKLNPGIQTATWGVPAAFQTPRTDATVARQVSSAWGIHHTEYNVQLKTDFLAALDTFLLHGEGRNDHIDSFMDGLTMWRTIADQGYKWVVRADEAFGWLPVRTELDARTSVAFAEFSDFNNIPEKLFRSFPRQRIPEHLQRYPGEPVEDFRDRLYQQYRLPFVIGPLQDLPLAFVEVLNPLLHPKLIPFVRALPPHQRTAKRLYAEWVDHLLPDIPYASIPAIPEAFHIAQADQHKQLFTEFFTDADSSRLLGNELMDFLRANWKTKAGGAEKIESVWKRQLKTMVPVGVKKFLRNKVTGYQLNTSSLALRAYIIHRMQKILKEVAE